jgi:hypothetical protein
MDTKDWISALGLALQYPVLIVAAIVVFGSFGRSSLRGIFARSEMLSTGVRRYFAEYCWSSRSFSSDLQNSPPAVRGSGDHLGDRAPSL